MPLSTFGTPTMHESDTMAFSIQWDFDFGSVYKSSYHGLVYNFTLPHLHNTKWSLNILVQEGIKDGHLVARLTRMEESDGLNEVELIADICLLLLKEPLPKVYRFNKSTYKHSEESETLPFIDFRKLKECFVHLDARLTVLFRLWPKTFTFSQPVIHHVKTTSTSRFITLLGKYTFLEGKNPTMFVRNGIKKDDPDFKCALYLNVINDKEIFGIRLSSENDELLKCDVFLLFDEDGCQQKIYPKLAPLNFSEYALDCSFDTSFFHIEVRNIGENCRVITKLDKIDGGDPASSMDSCKISTNPGQLHMVSAGVMGALFAVLLNPTLGLLLKYYRAIVFL